MYLDLMHAVLFLPLRKTERTGEVLHRSIDLQYQRADRLWSDRLQSFTDDTDVAQRHCGFRNNLSHDESWPGHHAISFFPVVVCSGADPAVL